MRRVLFAALAAFTCVGAAMASEAKWTQSNVSIGEGDRQLGGSLIVPGPWKDEYDAVIFISGSGPTDRDGNQPQAGVKTDAIKMIAMDLAEEGIASLRFDKRMVGASYHSGMREEDLRFDIYVEDARSWLAFLKTQGKVRRVYIIGHSEGALVGAIVAEGEGVDGYVSLEGAGDRASNIIRRQLREGQNGEQVAALAEPTIQKLEAGEIDPSPNAVLAQFFRASVQPYLISWFKFDPAEEIKKIPGRVLIVQGTTDLQVEMVDAERLRAARPDARYAEIERMNHILKIAPADRTANFATYSQPDLPLAPALMPALLGFITAH